MTNRWLRGFVRDVISSVVSSGAAFSIMAALSVMSASTALAYGNAYDIGIRAQAMGGAFRAVADDWTAMAYNPAGLAYIMDNQVGMNSSFHHNRYLYNTNYNYTGALNLDDAPSGYLNGVDVPNRHEIGFTPEGGIVLRSPFWGETVFGFSIYQTHDQDLDWKLFDGFGPGYSDFDFRSMDEQYSIDLDIVNFQLSAAREFVEDKLAVGLSVAVVRADLIHRNITLRDNPLIGSEDVSVRHNQIPEYTSHNGNGWGFGAEIGILWKATDKLQMAATFKPKSTVTVDGAAEFEFYLPQDIPYRNSEGFLLGTDEYLLNSGFTLKTASDFEVEVVAPGSIAGGLAFRASDKLRLSLDAEYTFWSQFKGFAFEYDMSKFDLNVVSVTPPPLLTALAETNLSFPNVWEDAGDVMFGFEYMHRDWVSLLGGFGAGQTFATNSTTTPLFVDNGLKYSGSLGLAVNVEQWGLQIMTKYIDQPDLTVSETADVNGDTFIDNVPASVSGARYRTAFGFTYRF